MPCLQLAASAKCCWRTDKAVGRLLHPARLGHGDQYRSASDQADPEPAGERQAFAEQQRCEDGHQHNAELVDRRNLRGLAQLQGAELTQPGQPGRNA